MILPVIHIEFHICKMYVPVREEVSMRFTNENVILQPQYHFHELYRVHGREALILDGYFFCTPFSRHFGNLQKTRK